MMSLLADRLPITVAPAAARSTAGEQGERLGRGVILDDGDYHYCLTVLQDADVTDCQIVWSEVFRTFDLV